MVETRERDRIYTTDADAGPSTALVVLFALLIIAVLGFMIYFFSSNDLRNSANAPQTIIERSTQTAVPVPVPAPNVNITPPSNNINITPPSNTENGATPSSPGNGQSTTP